MHLEAWRTRENLTLDDVAERLRALGVQVSSVSVGRHERFQRMPGRDVLRGYAKITNGEVTANDFVEPPEPVEGAVNV
ncbi:MAG: hypothetical protein A49_14060 [Methyloceanibacter sp.]|nr:MAG: hypothetical protein A49_14060 [Methyloceanibacter sp.]